jgi:hypothetical protein
MYVYTARANLQSAWLDLGSVAVPYCIVYVWVGVRFFAWPGGNRDGEIAGT